MVQLCIDTSSAQPGVAIRKGDKVVFTALTYGRGQSAELLAKTDALLEDNELSYEDITAGFVITGPGSFTGIRVGISFIKGIALSLDIPIYGMNAFDLAAMDVNTHKGLTLLAFESGRLEKFFAVADKGEILEGPFNLASQDMIKGLKNPPAFLLSDYEESAFAEVEKINHTPLAERLGKHADEIAKSGKAQEVTPFYVRPPDISKPKKKK